MNTATFIEPMTTSSVRKGERYGRLVVLGQTKIGPPIVLCACDCGNRVEIVASSLLPNKRGSSTKSCNCLRREGSQPIHGMCDSAEYDAWHSMKSRCLRSTHKQYLQYGGRGITIFPEWIESFEAFFAYIGPRPSPRHSLDRYPDNNGNYEPGNVRWATSAEQNRNRRGNDLLTIGDITLCIADWADVSGIPRSLVQHRLERKWKSVDAVFAPLQPRHRKFYLAKSRLTDGLLVEGG